MDFILNVLVKDTHRARLAPACGCKHLDSPAVNAWSATDIIRASPRELPPFQRPALHRSFLIRTGLRQFSERGDLPRSATPFRGVAALGVSELWRRSSRLRQRSRSELDFA